jgi:putative ABC transport system permease protein
VARLLFPMSFLEAIRLAFAQLRAQKLTSFFTLLGVVIGVTFLISVVSLVEGMGRYLRDDLFGRFLGANAYTLRARPLFSRTASPALLRELARNPPLLPSDVQPVVAALPAGTRWAVQTFEFAFFYASTPFARRRQVQGVAVDGDFFTIKNYVLQAGRVFSAQEAALGLPVVVIGDEVARHFFPNLDPLGRELRVGDIPYTVIGVIERQGSMFGISLDRLAVAPFASPMSRLFDPRGYPNGIVIQAAGQAQLNEAMETTREIMRARRQLRPVQPDNFVMETTETATAAQTRFLGILGIAGTALTSIGLLVGGVVIMNIMLVAVAERTREIGIRMAVGARRSDVMRQFLVEAATLSTLGAVLGIALGMGLSKLIEAITPIRAAVVPWSMGAAIVIGMIVGIAAGVYPAMRAARLDPVESLRHEA